MAYDRVEFDYHLTPDGWVLGEVRSMFSADDRTNPVPLNRVLTHTHRTYQASNYSSEERSVKEIWRGNVSEEEIAVLRARFPPPFDPADE